MRDALIRSVENASCEYLMSRRIVKGAVDIDASEGV